MVLIAFLVRTLQSQTIISPKYSLKSHETLNIIKIEARTEATLFYMSIENRIEGGTFCATRIYISFIPMEKKPNLFLPPEFLSVLILINSGLREEARICPYISPIEKGY